VDSLVEKKKSSVSFVGEDDKSGNRCKLYKPLCPFHVAVTLQHLQHAYNSCGQMLPETAAVYFSTTEGPVFNCLHYCCAVAQPCTACHGLQMYHHTRHAYVREGM